MKLWQSKSSQTLDPLIEQFTIGPDLIWDSYLLPYDCLASSAHAFMLQKKDHLKAKEFKKIKTILKEIYLQAIDKKFKLANTEDSHSAIEELLTKRLGELGGKIHLGRSRNDQAATAIHLFAKDELLCFSNFDEELLEKTILDLEDIGVIKTEGWLVKIRENLFEEEAESLLA